MYQNMEEVRKLQIYKVKTAMLSGRNLQGIPKDTC